MTNKALALIASLYALASPAHAGLNAKALFMGADGKVKTVPTQAAPAPTGTAVATSAKPTPAGGGAAPAKVATAPNIGAAYFIRLKNPDGTTRDVVASRTFKGGERFQLGVRVNKPSYIYVFNKDQDGQITQLFPQRNQSNRLDIKGVAFFPQSGAFQFDDKPGEQQLSIFVSPTPVDDLIARVRGESPDLVDGGRTAIAGGECSPANINLPPASVLSQASNTHDVTTKGISQVDACTRPTLMASKGIAFTEDPAPSPGATPASYVVKVEVKPSDTLHLQLKLQQR